MDELTVPGREPRPVDAGRGVGWWTDAWALFMKNAGMWVLMALTLMVIYVVLTFIPLVGGLAGSLLAPVFIGGWMLAARKLEDGGTLEVGDLFAGFKEKLTPLIVLGALLLAAMIVLGIVVGALGIGAMGGMMAGGANHSVGGMMAAAGTGMVALLIGFTMGFVVALALWFAPALVVFRDMPPVDALMASISASLKNIAPFLVYGLLYIVAAIVASIPFGLGWIVLVPVVMLSVYVSYKDVYEA